MGTNDGEVGPALTGEDLAFVKEVNDLKGPSRAVLRLEVPTQTSRFAGLARDDQ